MTSNKWLVCFDAVGTLINTIVPVAETYHTVGQKHGSKMNLAEISSRLKHYYPLYFSSKALSKLGCSEAKERANWKNLVTDIFNDVKNTDHLFSELWLYYSRPNSWAIIPETYQCLQDLHSSNIEIAIASNFDRRLNLIANQLIPEITNKNIFTSSSLGYAKPDIRFYAAIEKVYNREKFNYMMIGDDPINDHDAALEAGWQTCKLDYLADLKKKLYK